MLQVTYLRIEQKVYGLVYVVRAISDAEFGLHCYSSI